MSKLNTRTIDSPIGELVLVANEEGLCEIQFPSDDRDAAQEGDPTHPTLQLAHEQLDEYFAGQRRHFDLELAPAGTEFQHEVWATLDEIPFGETTSYGEQAESIGRPGAARAVGSANGRNPLPIVRPCHRVVGSNGALTGFAGGLDIKTFLLHHELEVCGKAPPQQRHLF